MASGACCVDGSGEPRHARWNLASFLQQADGFQRLLQADDGAGGRLEDVVQEAGDGGVGCVGAYEIKKSWTDPAADDRYVFELVHSPRFQRLLGEQLPIAPGQNPARILSGRALREVLDASPM
ncbi:hypothetical protein OG372_36510 [Streptomyces sp. NBC_01020]|uniref:hypothetical protein n=1 Tax=unclassified Streptomyces TaxID=2593676 RepID=UPI002E1D3877|nr:hypothetical protein OG372_36510 [Streptomyces sp. NBC_01020]